MPITSLKLQICNLRCIAALLGYSGSTGSRELVRNDQDKTYEGQSAQGDCQHRRVAPWAPA
ncbi:MAG: hypothetical protein KAY21_05955 [Limnohabitans sp.]|nr:hypothetical protein [Limnohabitans sp.]